MTLLHAILKKVQSNESVASKYPSPPPEINKTAMKSRKKKHTYKYAHVKAVVDTSPPRFDPLFQYRKLQEWSRTMRNLISENMKLVTTIKRQHFLRGRVDSSWPDYPKSCRQYFENRNYFYKRIRTANQYLYNRIINVKAKVPTTVSLRRDWRQNRNEILERARCKFVLFQPVPSEDIEDIQFKAPPEIKRPRIYLTLRFRHGAVLGDLPVELFTDVCPLTCQLFLDLVDGDGLGNGYIGTCFFR
ncbi:hypothetical protein K1T71_014504 [Dendrolimus kikuchii]|uniref:Uncharacterized protein n=1 Tax=Dendrolimus kikuchii TaxID=765133 RepID=A0ACC1CE97_9NEOP|nr:hypothetical protein K1T71_014504 [Dendrolimus kikuchii]